MYSDVEKQPRVVHLRVQARIGVEQTSDPEIPGHTRYTARVEGYPVEAEGLTPEGALVQAEVELQRWLEGKLEEWRSDG